jgi:hypothetical protein
MDSRIHLTSLLALALTGCVLDTKVVDNPDDSSSGGAATEGEPGNSTSSATEGGGTVADPDPSAATEPGTGTATTTGANPTVSGSATDGDPEPVQPCIETKTELALDQLSPGGFSAEQLLADKLGARVTTLKFANEPLSLSDQWKGKELPFTIELIYMGGPIEWIDSEFNPDYNDSGEDGPGAECNDRMNVGVIVDFFTEGGEFDENRPAVLEALTVEHASTSVEQFDPPVTGSFDVTTLYSDPEWVSEDLDMHCTWQGDKAGGELFNEVLVGGEGGFIGAGSVASWGDELF